MATQQVTFRYFYQNDLKCAIYSAYGVYPCMTNRYLLLFFFTIALISNATGQGSGKLIINADLTSIASYDPDIEVSVINMATNREVMRNSVLENFNYTFPLNGRFMLYIKKSGATSTRLLLDTRTFMSGYYTLSFHLSLGKV